MTPGGSTPGELPDRADTVVRLGVIGCGAFARFALGAVASSPRLTLSALADPRPDCRERAIASWSASHAEVRVYDQGEDLCRDPDTDLVWIVAPPHVHYPLTWAALQQGKAVFLEKPGALTPDQMKRLALEAASRGLPVGVDFVLRRTPIARLVGQIVDSGVLGPLERLALENVAHDERLPAGHWFWDPALSGGIFVEHGVHFFDLANWWCGPGEVDGALALRRTTWDHPAVDRVLALARHGRVVATYYHSFTTVERFERARWQLILHRGFLEVEGWIPIALRGEVLVTQEEEAWLRALPGCRTEPSGEAAPDRDPPWPGPGEIHPGQHPPWPERGDTPVSQGAAIRRKVRLEMTTPDRTGLYRQAIREGAEDIARCLLEPGRCPAVGLQAAVAALEMATRATALAKHC